MKTNRAFTLIELLAVIAILAILSAVVLGSGGCSASDGTRSGVITKFSYKGNFTKSWEGELLMGGLRSGANGNAVANVWEFSVDGGKDSELAKKIDRLVSKPVKVKYRQTFCHNPLTRSTSYYVVDVEEADSKAEKMLDERR